MACHQGGEKKEKKGRFLGERKKKPQDSCVDIDSRVIRNAPGPDPGRCCKDVVWSWSNEREEWNGRYLHYFGRSSSNDLSWKTAI